MRSAITLPRRPRTPAGLDAWFESLAGFLLHGVVLVAGSRVFRISEVEIYFRSAQHADPYVHADLLQREWGRWYFHRHGGGYRGGSFKGLDVTIGSRTSHGGVLIRAMASRGRRIEGPSLCVDELLRCTGVTSVAKLDDAIAGRAVGDVASPLCLVPVTPGNPGLIVRGPRVGLSRHRTEAHLDFVDRPYRFVADPRHTTKGADTLARALHRQGRSADEICGIMGRCRAVIARWLAPAHE